MSAPLDLICEHYPSLLDTPKPVLGEVYRMHGNLLLKGLTDVLHFEGDEQVIVAYEAGDEPRFVLGAIVWRETEPGEWWTQMGYVNAAFRGRGVYRMMWSTLIEIAHQDGTVRNIVGGTAVDNKKMQALMEKMGRKPASIIYKFEL